MHGQTVQLVNKQTRKLLSAGDTEWEVIMLSRENGCGGTHWQVICVRDDVYQLVNVKTNKFLDAHENHTNVVMWPRENGVGGTHWILDDSGDDEYNIELKNVETGKVLDSHDNNHKVIMWPRGNDTGSAMWKAKAVEAEHSGIAYSGWIDGFHQTDKDSAKNIIASKAFRRGSKGALGGAIYFALSEEDTEGKALSKGVMFQCRIKAGRVKVVEHWDPRITQESLFEMGYDTVLIHGSGTSDASRPEYAVFDPTRVAIVKYYDM